MNTTTTTTTSNITTNITTIKTLLTQLDNTFYNNIDSGLIQHPDLCSFAFTMNNIINTIKNSLEQIEHSSISINNSLLPENNIDYAQLRALSTIDR